MQNLNSKPDKCKIQQEVELKHIEKPFFDTWAKTCKDLGSYAEKRAARLGWEARSLFRPDNDIVINALQEKQHAIYNRA